MASAKKKSKSSVSSRKPLTKAFVLCVRNDDYPASLELRKLYPVIRDTAAEKHDLVRVIDESGEDYLYPSSYFISLRLPKSVEIAIALAS